MSFGKFIGKLLGLDETGETTNEPQSAKPVTIAETPEVEVEVFQMPSADDLERRAVIRNAMSVHRAQQASLSNLSEEDRLKLRAIAEQAFLSSGDGQTHH